MIIKISGTYIFALRCLGKQIYLCNCRAEYIDPLFLKVFWNKKEHPLKSKDYNIT